MQICQVIEKELECTPYEAAKRGNFSRAAWYKLRSETSNPPLTTVRKLWDMVRTLLEWNEARFLKELLG